ncbi:MAG TPA: glycosyltransferase family 4 protein [Opitutales bacterium]|nr:glycosyltransferase family 4 protein [Opitutales bacterium]
MKIAYLSDSRLPTQSANSIHVMHAAEALGKQGHEVLLVGFWGTKQIPSRWSIDLYDYYNTERTFGIRRYFNGGFGKRDRKSRWKSIIRQMVREDFDLVWTRNLHAAECATQSGLPTLFEIHQPFFGSDEERQIEVLRRMVDDESLLAVVTITKALRDFVIHQYDLPASKIIVAPDGARRRKNELKRRGADHEGAFKVGYIGSFYSGKGIEIVLPLANRCSDIQFTVIGGDPKSIQEVRRKYGAGTNVCFTGYLTQKEIELMKDDFDVFLLPNQRSVRISGGNDIGSFTSPLKLFEYMAVGRPILASNLPVLTEILTDEVNSLLCDPSNLDEWESQLRRLQNDEALRHRLGQQAKETFEKKYTWETRMSNVIRDVVVPHFQKTVSTTAFKKRKRNTNISR